MPVRNQQVEGEALPHVYGPVKSRRHGLSLGINVGLESEKICTWSCLYCQCGFGSLGQLRNKPVERVSVQALIDQVKASLVKNTEVECITLAGNTEPGTYPDILGLIKALIKLKVMSRAKWKINILSNGSELHREEVRQAFDMADEAWIKLDVGTEDLFHKLNRPLPEVGTLSDHIERIKKLRKIRIQTLIWNSEKKELSNCHESNLEALVRIYKELNPLDLQITTIARDPAMPGLVPVDQKLLDDFSLKAKKAILNVSG